MRAEYILAVVGCLLGAVGALVIYLTLPSKPTPDGAQFESLEDLRKAMLQHDERDEKDGSVSLRSLIAPHPSDLIIYELKPNLNVRFQKVTVQTNSFGMRGPEISLEKPSAVYRIILLGDSFAFGWGVEQDKTFAAVTEEELNKGLNGKGSVQVLNFGVPGYSTFQEVAQFEEKGLRFNPDAVLIYIIENDFGLPFFIKDLEQGEKLVPGANFHKSYEGKNADQVNAKKSELFGSMDASQSLKRLAKLCSSKGIKLFAAINPNKNAGDTLKKMWSIPQLKNHGKLTFFDLRPEYVALLDQKIVPEETMRLHGDPHPGPGGHKLVGILLARNMKPFVEAAKMGTESSGPNLF